jgi:hypothetical protein
MHGATSDYSTGHLLSGAAQYCRAYECLLPADCCLHRRAEAGAAVTCCCAVSLYLTPQAQGAACAACRWAAAATACTDRGPQVSVACVPVRCSTVQYSAVQCSTVQYSAVRSIVQGSTQYCTGVVNSVSAALPEAIRKQRYLLLLPLPVHTVYYMRRCRRFSRMPHTSGVLLPLCDLAEHDARIAELLSTAPVAPVETASETYGWLTYSTLQRLQAAAAAAFTPALTRELPAAQAALVTAQASARAPRHAADKAQADAAAGGRHVTDVGTSRQGVPLDEPLPADDDAAAAAGMDELLSGILAGCGGEEGDQEEALQTWIAEEAAAVHSAAAAAATAAAVHTAAGSPEPGGAVSQSEAESDWGATTSAGETSGGGDEDSD